MPKLFLPFTSLLTAALAPLAAVQAGTIGPHATQCEGHHPAMVVRVIGLKDRSGIVRIQSYGGDPETFLDKGAYIERIDLPTPPNGAVEVCVPVPRAGVYAVSVRHKVGKSDMDDGGGVSGNPGRSLMDLLFKRKPPTEQISVRVGGVVTVPVVMNYVQGGSFKPVKTAER